MSNQLPIKDIIEWDVLNWAEIIPVWTPILNTLPKSAKILAIGERNGGLSLWLALMGFDVVCTDREGPTDTADKLHKKYGVREKITYKAFDVVNEQWEKEQFDIVIAKSVIGGLKADPKDRTTRNFEVHKQAVHNMYSLLKKGGYFLSVENMKGAALVHAMRQLAGKNKGWRHLHWGEIKDLYGEFSSIDTKAFGVLPTLFSNDTINRLNYFFNKNILQILPPQTKYVAITTAQK